MSTRKKHQRRLTRYYVDVQIDVLNQMTGEVIGSIVDIHTEGLMLVGMVEVDCVYMIRLVPQEQAQKVGDIELGIDCLWTSSLEQGESCWAGCRIIDASEDALAKVERLINEFGKPRPD
jgi:hypothetical protein